MTPQPIPALNDESLYLAVDIKSGDSYNYAVVEVPTDRLARFIEIPGARARAWQGFYRAGQYYQGLPAADVPRGHPDR